MSAAEEDAGAMTVLGPRFAAAIAYALDLHRDQARKGGGAKVPYAAHLLAVCALVLEDGGGEDEAIAALLHDALEDQPGRTSADAIEGRFGAAVRAIVEACSDTGPGYGGGAKRPWRERKEAYLAGLRRGHADALRVAVADKLHNVRGLAAGLRLEGDAFWSRFNAGRQEQVWYYGALVEALRAGGACGRLMEEFARAVEEFQALAANPREGR